MGDKAGETPVHGERVSGAGMSDRDGALPPGFVPRCLGCGYDLSGPPDGRCPECGGEFSLEALEAAWQASLNAAEEKKRKSRSSFRVAGLVVAMTGGHMLVFNLAAGNPIWVKVIASYALLVLEAGFVRHWPGTGRQEAWAMQSLVVAHASVLALTAQHSKSVVMVFVGWVVVGLVATFVSVPLRSIWRARVALLILALASTATGLIVAPYSITSWRLLIDNALWPSQERMIAYGLISVGVLAALISAASWLLNSRRSRAARTESVSADELSDELSAQRRAAHPPHPECESTNAPRRGD